MAIYNDLREICFETLFRGNFLHFSTNSQISAMILNDTIKQNVDGCQKRSQGYPTIMLKGDDLLM